jgi:hypothetical protein
LMFKHLARREAITMQSLCFFKWSMFLFLTISIFSYSDIIWIRNKAFFLNKCLLNISEYLWRTSRWSHDANIASGLKGRVPKYIYIYIYILIYNFFNFPLFSIWNFYCILLISTSLLILFFHIHLYVKIFNMT